MRVVPRCKARFADCHNYSAHVHLEEPGNQDWEGFWTGTQAAAAGGVTTLIDMPVDSSPPTTTPRNLDNKRRSARGQCWVDVGFWGGAIPQNQVSAPAYSIALGVHHLQAELGPLLSAGVRGFKCFLIDTGIEVIQSQISVHIYVYVSSHRNSLAFLRVTFMHTCPISK